MIESTGNAQVKNLTRLIKNRSERKKQNCFIVEGPKMVFEAIEQNAVNKVYVAQTMWKALNSSDSAFLSCDNDKNNRLAGLDTKEALSELVKVECEVVADKVFAGISDTVTPQGMLAVAGMRQITLEELLKMNEDKTARYIILENLQDPGNLGTILRTAEAAGYDGIIMTKGTVDIYNPKVVRSTMGAIFRVPFTYADDIETITGHCQNNGITVAGAALDGDDIRNVIFPPRLAIIIGNESNGMSDIALGCCDSLIRIPMKGQAESLNASVAAGILMYESVL